jgi:hypothetical protein
VTALRYLFSRVIKTTSIDIHPTRPSYYLRGSFYSHIDPRSIVDLLLHIIIIQVEAILDNLHTTSVLSTTFSNNTTPHPVIQEIGGGIASSRHY